MSEGIFRDQPACARHYRKPLLYKGDDFTRTDIETA